MEYQVAEIMHALKNVENRVSQISQAIINDRQNMVSLKDAEFDATEGVKVVALNLQSAAMEGDAQAVRQHQIALTKAIERAEAVTASIAKDLDGSPKVLQDFAEIANASAAVAPLLRILWDAMPDLPPDVQRKFSDGMARIKWTK